jgi:hypothetical protein
MDREPMPPLRYHEKNHDGPFAGCWRCERAQAICRGKRRYDTRETADAAVRAVNEREGYASPVVRYRCRWCPSWHLTTARDKRRVKRAEKQRRKWVIGRTADAGLASGSVLVLSRSDNRGQK